MYKDRKINDINRTTITSRKTLKVKTIISTNGVVAIEDVLEISTTKKISLRLFAQSKISLIKNHHTEFYFLHVEGSLKFLSRNKKNIYIVVIC